MEYLFHIAVQLGVFVLLSLGLNLLVGNTGLPALGHGAFFCIGSYASALATIQYSLHPIWGLLIGGAVATVCSLAVSYPALRLRGDYFALATFGLAVIVHSLAKNWKDLTGGSLGISNIPDLHVGLPMSIRSLSYLSFAAGTAAVCVLLLRKLLRSPYGRALEAVRSDETALRTMGHNSARFKIQTVALAGCMAGLAGSLYAHYMTFIDPTVFTAGESIVLVLIVVLGGLGSVRGSLVGAAIIVCLPEVLRFVGLPAGVAAPMRQLIFGLLLVFLVLYRPKGICGRYRFE